GVRTRYPAGSTARERASRARLTGRSRRPRGRRLLSPGDGRTARRRLRHRAQPVWPSRTPHVGRQSQHRGNPTVDRRPERLPPRPTARAVGQYALTLAARAARATACERYPADITLIALNRAA